MKCAREIQKNNMHSRHSWSIPIRSSQKLLTNLVIILRFEGFNQTNSWHWRTPGAVALSNLYSAAKVVVSAHSTAVDSSLRDHLVRKLKANTLQPEWRITRSVLSTFQTVPAGPLNKKAKLEVFNTIINRQAKHSRRLPNKSH